MFPVPFSGKLPAELGELTLLQHLDLSKNEISGEKQAALITPF